ncbi:MAG: apolipoprotein N-acyltransferase, partial [Burkholderiales bacterium]
LVSLVVKVLSPAFASLLLGALSVFGYAPFYLYPVPILTLAAISSLWIGAASTRGAAGLGLCFGLGLFLGGTSWVYVSLHDYGGMPMPVAGASTLFFCGYLAAYPAAIAALVRRARGDWSLKLVLLLPALWALSEWVRSWLFTGFPWLALGYSQAPASPLAGFAPVLGVYGVSLASACVAGCLALACQRYRSLTNVRPAERIVLAVNGAPLWIALALLLVGFGLASRQWTTPLPGSTTRVALIQGNIPQELKWRPERARETLERYHELTRSTDATLILLPETALPMFNVDLPHGYLDALAAHARANGGDLLTGIPEYAGPGRYFNSVMSLGSAPSQIYRKVHLVPFGDYFPLRWALGWFMNLLDIPMADFSRGSVDQRPLEAAGQRVAANICYEDVFGEEIIRQLPAATILANFTNDAWWGRSVASQQHLQISQMRSLETGRYMLRATNTGVTAIIDSRGRVVKAAPEFETVIINGEAVGFSGSTPFIRWGNSAVLVLAGVLIAAALIAARR